MADSYDLELMDRKLKCFPYLRDESAHKGSQKQKGARESNFLRDLEHAVHEATRGFNEEHSTRDWADSSRNSERKMKRVTPERSKSSGAGETLAPYSKRRLLIEHVCLLQQKERVFVVVASTGDDDLHHEQYELYRQYAHKHDLEVEIYTQGPKQMLFIPAVVTSNQLAVRGVGSGTKIEFSQQVQLNHGITVGYEKEKNRKTSSSSSSTTLPVPTSSVVFESQEISYTLLLSLKVQLWTNGSRRVPEFLSLVTKRTTSILPYLAMFERVLDEIEGDVELIIKFSEAIHRIRGRNIAIMRRQIKQLKDKNKSTEQSIDCAEDLETLLLKQWDLVLNDGCPLHELDQIYEELLVSCDKSYLPLHDSFHSKERYVEIMEAIALAYPEIFATTCGHLPKRYMRRGSSEKLAIRERHQHQRILALLRGCRARNKLNLSKFGMLVARANQAMGSSQAMANSFHYAFHCINSWCL